LPSIFIMEKLHFFIHHEGNYCVIWIATGQHIKLP
jgi:hypothetical protein